MRVEAVEGQEMRNQQHCPFGRVAGMRDLRGALCRDCFHDGIGGGRGDDASELPAGGGE